jgi:hypothetical protein
VVSAGDIVRASDGGTAETSFTPSFTNFTVGNGSVAGSWRRIAKTGLIFFTAQFVMGSTSAVGGTLGLTVPGGLSGDGAVTTQVVSAWAWDNSLASMFGGGNKLAGGGGTALDRFYFAGTAANGTTPFTWAANDFLLVEGLLRVTT